MERIVQLKRVVGPTDDTRYYADDKEVTKQEFWRIWDSASRHDSMLTMTRGTYTFLYTSAYFP